MSHFRFDQLQWIYLGWLVVAFVVVLVWLDQRGSTRLNRFLSTLMQQRLMSRPKRFRRLLRIVLLGVCGVFLVLALMRPQAGLHRVQTPRVGAQLMVCLDVSKSMLAEDVRPNRLRRAKTEVMDLLAFLEKDHVGLIAFAGKATVLCPLTPDFGFLRNVIESAGPNSVVRGGTDLEAPIRKALDGFRGQSDLSRVIILITDGEDHDSFPQEAAKAAAEKGVRIITIGFGDETGSEVQITNPHTGARTTLLNADGRPVITKLDGETLRRIAVETGGVYVPAGTGMLDLKAIYDTHIAPLTRGRLEDFGRLVIQEQFQWPILFALCCLTAAATVASGRPKPQVPSLTIPAPASVGAIVALFVFTMNATVFGVDLEPSSVDQSNSDKLTEDETPEDSQPDEIEVQEEEVDPRLVYNDALALLTADNLDEADAQFSLARRHAGADGLARYSATYNLGWVEVKRANQFIKENPQQALAHLQAAADWFREAVRLQPDEEVARENLEIVGRRAWALADALAREEHVDVAVQIDDLIAQQRDLTVRLQGTVQRVKSLEQPTIPETLRNEFRSLELEQREIMSRLEEVSQHVRDEIERLQGIEKEQRTPEQGLRLAQLQYVQAYLYQASQRVGQTRRHLRGRQARRAYRRASVTLGQLKRARDQLRGLVEVLGAVIGDATQLTKQTVLFASDTIPAIGRESKEIEAPVWLTRDFLRDSLGMVRERTDELVARVEAGLASENVNPEEEENVVSPSSGESTDRTAGSEDDQQHLLAMLREAEPLIDAAADHFRAADEAHVSERDFDAYQSDAQGTANLMQARELFLDVQPLIELIYAEQRRMQLALEELEKVEQEDKVVEIDELVGVLPQLQALNTHRGNRLAGLLDRQLEQIRRTAPPPAMQPAPVPEGPQGSGSGDDAEAIKAQTQKLELARGLLDSVFRTFSGIERLLKRMSSEQKKDADLSELQHGVGLSVEQIESLRRLFFSLIEHLQDTLRRQVELADETRDAATLSADEQAHGCGPLVDEQQQLSMISEKIAESLHKQSEQPPPQIDPIGADPNTAQASQVAADRLRRAAGHVGEAKVAMDQAYSLMSAESAMLVGTQEHQNTAIQKLAAAIQLLAPPPQQQQGQDQQEQKGEDEGQQPDKTQGQDMSRLLQSVRDRDAQRQRDKRSHQQSGYAPVEKDW